MKVAVFSTKRYDRISPSEANAAGMHTLEFFEPNLGERAAALAAHYPVVCPFVNGESRCSKPSAFSMEGSMSPRAHSRRMADESRSTTAARSRSVGRNVVLQETHMGLLKASTRRKLSSGSSFEREIGYSRAVVCGDRVYVSGTIGFDYTTMTSSADVAVQTEQCLRNIEYALREAGAAMRDVVRVRYILPDARDFPATWPALRAAFGEIRPAATMIQAGLADPRMRIEIDVDAIIGSA